MTINYSNGRSVDVKNLDEAREVLERTYPDAEYGDWEQSGFAPERMLVWADGESSENDDGANAVASISR